MSHLGGALILFGAIGVVFGLSALLSGNVYGLGTVAIGAVMAWLGYKLA